jgi:hypothetical protein
MTAFLKKLLLILSITILAINCTSCGQGISVPNYKAPLSPLVDRVEIDQAVETPIVKANIYFDNTQSMFGYVTRGEVSNYVVTVNSLLDLIEGLADYSLYALRPDERNILVWQDIGPVGSFNYYVRDFYTYWGVFERRGDGPLQLLFAEDAEVVDFDDINIFITDLGEQNMRNIVLARRLNNIILERDNYAILLYCIQSQFSGMAAVPLHGVVSPTGESLTMAVDNNFSDIRPFYMLLTGPTEEIIKLSGDIAASLDSAGLSESLDYFRSIILPNRGIQRTEIDKLVTFCMEADTPEHRITMANSNVNFNFLTFRYEDLFSDIDRALPGLNFAYTAIYTPDRNERNHGKINTILPLNALIDGRPATNVSYRIDYDQAVILGGSFVDMEEAAEAGLTVDKQIDEKVGFAWTEIDSYEYNQFLKVDLEYLFPDEEIWHLQEVPEDLRRREFENDLLYQVNNDSGALNYELLFVDIDNIDYDYISLYMPVYGVVERHDHIPDWIEDFNLTTREPFDRNNPGATPDYFIKTDGLLEFYKLLLGDYTSSVELEQFESLMEKRVTELFVNVCLSWEE